MKLNYVLAGLILLSISFASTSDLNAQIIDTVINDIRYSIYKDVKENNGNYFFRIENDSRKMIEVDSFGWNSNKVSIEHLNGENISESWIFCGQENKVVVEQGGTEIWKKNIGFQIFGMNSFIERNSEFKIDLEYNLSWYINNQLIGPIIFKFEESQLINELSNPNSLVRDKSAFILRKLVASNGLTIGKGNIYENYPGYWEERIKEINFKAKPEEIKELFKIDEVHEKKSPQPLFQRYQLDNSIAIRLSSHRLGDPPVVKSYRKIKINLEDDVLGAVRMYYVTGILFSDETYLHGEYHGIQKYYNSKGALTETIEYDTGKKTSQTKYTNGIQYITEIYSNDINTKVILYDEKGEVFTEFIPQPRRKRKGKRKRYY